LVSDSASSTLFEAFGGFDLDDKVISDLSFLTDTNGNRRLASFVWRQPTGPQEFALMFPHLDEGTLTRLLGSETQFAERFQMLAGAVSDSISEERFGRVPTTKIGVTAEELSRLTEEEKIIKYVSLLSKGQSASAKRYIQGMDANNPQFFESVEKAIFRILDVGKEVNGQNLGLEFEGAQRIGIEKILKHMSGVDRVMQDDYRFINLPQINNRVVEMASRGRFGTPLAMTAEEAAEIAKTDAGFAAQYRRSNFIKMFESKMSIAEDPEIVSTVRNIIDANSASFSGDSAASTFALNRTRIVNSIGSSRAVGDTEVAYRIAGQILNPKSSYSQELRYQIEEAINASFNRQQFTAFGAEDGLGIYINKLGFATSLDQQREGAINSIIERLQTSGATLEGSAISDNMTESILERMRQLRYNSSPVYGPEPAIDAALAGGGGTRKITGSVEELYEAARIYYTNAYGADPVSIRRAINEGISGLAVLKKDVDEIAYGRAMRAIDPGVTDAAIKQSLQDIKTGKTNLSGLVESLLNYAGDTPEATAVRKMAFEFLDVGADSVGTAAVARASRNVGEIFAYQVAFGMDEKIGFDRFTTNLKLSTAKGKGVPEVINVAKSFLEGVEAAENNLGGRGGTEQLSLIKSKMLGLIQDYEKDPQKFGRKKLNELKAIFVNDVGIDEGRSVGVLTETVDELAKEIASKKQKLGALRTSATAEIEGIRAALSSGPHTASAEKFADEMVKTNDELLKTMHSLNSILSDLSGKNTLYNFSPEDKQLQFRMQSFFDGLRADLAEEDPLPKRQIQIFTDIANARLAESRGGLSKSVMDYINQSVIDNPDDPAAIVKRLQALIFTQKNYNSFATSDPAKRAFGQILENIFSPQGDFAINTKYEIGGREYVLSDLIEFARAKTTKDLFELQAQTQMDDIIGYIESAKGSKLAGQDLFSQQTLDDFGYSRAKAFVKSETESLIKVPQTIQQLPPEIEDALARVGPSLEAGMRAAYDTPPPPSSGKLSLSLARSFGDEINPAINADLVNDLFSLAMEKQERVEDIVRRGFENRTRKVMGASISDENLRIASDAYLTTLRRIIALRRAQDSYEMLRAANPAMVNAIEDAMVLAGDQPVVGGIDDILQGFSAEIDDLEATAEATRRSLNEAIIDEVIPAKYTRAGDYFKRVLNENPQLGSMVKGAFQNKGKVLAGAATAAGLAIFAMKKRGDRTQDEISGPPLLPGGNPYENLPTTASQIPQAPVSQRSAGASYNVSINATQDQIDEFMLRAGYLSNGQIQGTMHNSLPDLGRNPYDDIAGSF